MKRQKYIENLLVLVAIIITFFAITSGNFFGKKLSLEIGQISPETIYAPFQVENELATARKKTLASQVVTPVYTIDQTVEERALETIDLLFKYVEAIKGTDIAENHNITKVEQLKMSAPILLYEDEYEFLLEQSIEDVRNMHTQIIDVTQVLFEEGIDDTENVAVLVRNALDQTPLTGLAQKVAYDIITSQIKPNHIVDLEGTEKARTEAMDGVEPIYVL
ncbi:MAG: hypothetical protein ACRCW2_04730, partial [Cellulosilyticaceae bacterium]